MGREAWHATVREAFELLLGYNVYFHIHICTVLSSMGFPGGSNGKESACNVGDSGCILRLGRSPRERYGNPLQYFCPENPMDRRAWRATVHGVAKSCRTRLSV